MSRFSVCIPLFNGGAYIERAVTSVLEQSAPDWDLHIADDASTDDSLVRVARLPDPRITIHRSATNRGLAANWSYALGLADAPHCLLLGQDDALRPDAIALLSEEFARHPDAALIGFAATVIDISDAPRSIPRRHLGRIDADELFRLGVSLRDTPAPSQSAFRTDVVRALGYFDEAFDYCPEIDLQCRIAAAGHHAVFLADELALRSNDPGRATGRLRTTPVPLRDHYRLLAKHASSAPSELVAEQRRALRHRGTRLALHHLKHGRVRESASFAKHVWQGERSVTRALR